MPELARAESHPNQAIAVRYMHIVEPGAGIIELPIPESFAPLTAQQFVATSLLSIGKTLNQIRKMTDVSRGEAVEIERGAQARLGVEAPSALVHQAIRCGILPITIEQDRDLVRGMPASDRYVLKAYAQGVPAERIAGTLGMTVPKFIKYEPILMRKVGAHKRPQAVRHGHELGILD